MTAALAEASSAATTVQAHALAEVDAAGQEVLSETRMREALSRAAKARAAAPPPPDFIVHGDNTTDRQDARQPSSSTRQPPWSIFHAQAVSV